MIGKILYKKNLNSNDYALTAMWCNENNAHIEDMGSYYEVVANPVYTPTEEEIQQYFEDAIELYMTKVVQTRNYRDIHTAASYVNSTNPTVAREGAACNKWRDDVWNKCYAILAEVKTGIRPIPTLEEVIAELPKLDWGDPAEENTETVIEEIVEEGGTE